MTQPTDTTDDIEQTPDFWFVVLFCALRESDLATAAEAQEHLAERGIDVAFRRLLPDGEVSRD
jgi:hypothetical protein